MPGTIVDRILAEYNTRKNTRESIIKRKIGSPAPGSDGAEGAAGPEAGSGHPVRSPLPTSSAEQFIIRFRDELVPVIGNAVSSEVAQALSKVKTDLVDCLERQFRRLSPPTRMPPTLADRLDSTETDLDLPADEVNRQLNRVFAEMEPVGDGMPFAKTVIMPSLDRLPPREESALVESGDTGEIAPVLDELPRAESPELELEMVELEMPPAPAAFAPPEKAQEKADFLPWESNVAKEPPVGTRTASAPLPEPFAPRETHSTVETGPWATAEAPPMAAGHPLPPATVPAEEEAPEIHEHPSASQFVQEIREALIPGIAAGISQVLEELEKGQDRLSKELSSLASRVTGLERGPVEAPLAVLPDDPQYIDDFPYINEPPILPPTLAHNPVWPVTLLPQVSEPAAPRVSEPVAHPRELARSAPPVGRPAEEPVPAPALVEEKAVPPHAEEAAFEPQVREPAGMGLTDVKDVILLELREMEKRVIRKIESLKPRTKKKKAPAAASPSADNFP